MRSILAAVSDLNVHGFANYAIAYHLVSLASNKASMDRKPWIWSWQFFAGVALVLVACAALVIILPALG